jgi:hypothetical protein
MYTPKEISGGGGVKYNASIILILGKGKLDDAEAEKKAKEKNIDAVRVGVTIYVTPFKQRFARPIKVQLHIPFYKAPNPYVGLEKFVSWDVCGILRGKALTQKLYEKLDPKKGEHQKDCLPFDGFDMVTNEKGIVEKIPNDIKWVLPWATAKYLVCKHLGGQIPLVELFTDKVFTEEILRELDEKIIKPTFQLPDINSLDDLEELAEIIDDEEIDE